MTDHWDQFNDCAFGGAAPTAAASLHLSRVLLIDGEDVSRFRIASDLKQAGAIVDFASNADEALESLSQAHRLLEPYDLVILDLQAFGAEGFKVAERLRAAQYAGPILALTDQSPRRIGKRCIEAGCDELLRKPMDPSGLNETAGSLVERERTRRYVLARPDEVTSELAAYPELMMMLRRFVSNLPDTIESLLAAQRQRDIQKLRDELDLIKRNATSHGYVEIRASAVAAQQELNHSSKTDASEVSEALHDLVDICRRATASPSKPPPTSGPPLPPSG